jgi:hypothetical protein
VLGHPVKGRDSNQTTFGRAPLKHSRSRSRSNKNRVNLTEIDDDEIEVQRSPLPRDLEELVRMSVFNELKKQQKTRYYIDNYIANIDLHVKHNMLLKTD